MPSSYLYAINNEGRVFGLSTSGSMWREFMYLGLEFKQLSAVPHFMWAIGGDRQVYVHVHGLDIPIRIKEETYENEVRVETSQRHTIYCRNRKRLLLSKVQRRTSERDTQNC